MKILVTGATGFIGNHVINELLSTTDNEIVATATSAEKARTFSWYNSVRFVEHKIADPFPDQTLFQKFDRPDKLIHLAWSGLPNYKQLFHFEEVLPAQYFFIKSLATGGITDITVAGTCFEYGMQQGELFETAEPKPDNPYALAKDSLRRFLEQLQKSVSFSLKWARLFYMFGEGQNEKSLLQQLQKAIDQGDKEFNMSGGEQVRDYLPVGEVARYLVAIAQQCKVTGIINCCSNRPQTVRELVEDFLKKSETVIKLNLGYYPYPDYEPFSFWGNNKKLNSIVLNAHDHRP